MVKQYIKMVINKKKTFAFIKLNIVPSVLELLLFFILPLTIRKYYIIGQYEAIAINSIFLFLFESSIVFISKHALNTYVEEKKYNGRIFSKAIFFAFLKTIFFILFIYLFKKAIKVGLYLAFLLCFSYIFLCLITFWLPCLIVKSSFISSLKKSIHLYFSYPFFTVFVLLHSVVLFIFSMILLNIYPGLSNIMYNMHLALSIIEEKLTYSHQERKQKIILH